MGKKTSDANLAKKKAPKVPQTAPKTAKPEGQHQQQEEVSVVDEKPVTVSMAAEKKNLTDRKHSGLSLDGQVRLLDLARRTFVEETDPELQFPQAVRKDINDVVAVGILCTLAEHGANGDNQFANVLNVYAYPALSRAAENLGFKLPDIKLLPEGKEAGTVVLPASEVKVPKDTQEQIKKEKAIREGEKPELDPEKITSEEDLKKALEYMFVSSKGERLPNLLANAIDFMKKFRLHEASLAENADEAKARFENYNSGDWLDDVFSYFRPPIFFNGIGRGMANVTAVEKSPVHAFIILRDAIKDKTNGVPVLDDQEIAYCVKSIVKWHCDVNIESNKKAIEGLDEKKNKKEIEMCNKQIAHYNEILDCITDPSSDIIDTLLDNIGSHFDDGGSQLTTECQKTNNMYNHVCKSYYGKALSSADYKNLDENVQQYCYHIVNLFRSPGDQIMDCGITNVTELEERTEEEKAE